MMHEFIFAWEPELVNSYMNVYYKKLYDWLMHFL